MQNILCLVFHKTECKSTTFLYTDKIFFHNFIHNNECQYFILLKIFLHLSLILTFFHQLPYRFSEFRV